MKINPLLISLVLALFMGTPSFSKVSTNPLPEPYYVDAEYCRKTMNSVDRIITRGLYDKRLAETVWKEALARQKQAILTSKTLRELGININKAIAELKSSHCNFVTTNDEMYFFLHSMFSDFNKKLGRGKMDYVGFHTGGVSFDENQVRYVLDGGPAARAGIEIGDRILQVSGKPYVGEMNFLNTAGTLVKIDIDRNGERKTIEVKPEKAEVYDQYCESMKKSVSIDKVGSKTIGYVHVWSGGNKSHETLDELLSSDKLNKTDGLIFDLRDGYGGNDLSDLDRFYRDPKAYPIFSTVMRTGKKTDWKEYYDKPIVCLINGGSRSGKELLAFSLKRTGRAKLVGEKTAGAVLGGRLMPIDERCSMYIAVFDGTVDGVRLEGNGVTPDLVVENGDRNKKGYEKQVEAARDELLKLIGQ